MSRLLNITFISVFLALAGEAGAQFDYSQYVVCKSKTNSANFFRVDH